MKKNTVFYCLEYILATILCLAAFISYEYAPIRAIRYIVLVNMLIYLAHVDYKQKIIPNKALLVMFIIRFILFLPELIIYRQFTYTIILTAFSGLAVGGLVFLLAYIIIKNSVGMGDVKLVAVIGFYTGIYDLFSCILLSLIVSLMVCSFLIIAKKISKGDFVPFAPFLAFGTSLTLLLAL